ncbi:MAG: hypothetical protein OEZ11_13370 [Gammaproteobacteria bacterium]|nr:hypothetical protein [Gammaproteobacteria bacterium]
MTNGRCFPFELPGRVLKLAAREWRLSANGEVRYALNTSRSNGCFRDIMEFRQ